MQATCNATHPISELVLQELASEFLAP